LKDERSSSQVEASQLEVGPYSLFIGSIGSPETKKKYLQRMGYFLDYLNIRQNNEEESFEVLTQKANVNTKWLVNAIFKYLQGHKDRVERKEISSATLRNYVKPIRLYCEQMDFQVPWKKIMRGMPKGRRYANDRAPTLEEIKKVLAYPDRRMKPIICTMTSSGIRLSAWDYLKRKHIVPVIRDGQVVAGRILVYADDDDEYFSFISREAFDALQEWMTYRKGCGEKVTDESWLMRNLWDVTTPKGKGVITIPKRLKSTGIKRLIERALWAQGIRLKLEEGKRRHEFQADHGFRKWFKTRCESAGMRSINIETLMSHSIGLSDSYYRPTEDEILDDYLKATLQLTICGNAAILEKRISELTKENEDKYSILESRILEKENESKVMKKQLNRLLSLLIKESVDGKPALEKEVFDRLVSGEDDRLQLLTTDCEYQDPIGYDVPSQDILIVRKEMDKKKDCLPRS
jgi:integrase